MHQVFLDSKKFSCVIDFEPNLLNCDFFLYYFCILYRLINSVRNENILEKIYLFYKFYIHGYVIFIAFVIVSSEQRIIQELLETELTHITCLAHIIEVR